MKQLFILIAILASFSLFAVETPWSSEYQKALIEKASQQMPTLSTYPSLEYPNSESQKIINKFPEEKILLFGYVILINQTAAARSVGPDTIQSMKPAIAFGFKRLFNYKAGNVSKFGADLPENDM